MPDSPVRSLSRRRFLAGLAGLGVAGALSGASRLARATPFPESCMIRRDRVAGPAGWAGRRLLFVTDIHYGNFFGPAEAASLNAQVRCERPDLVLLGGDLADGCDTDLGGFFAHWAPGCPTLYSPGNHDTGRGGDSAVERQARAHGLVHLRNAVESWRGIDFIGLPSALRARQELALLRRPGWKIVLAHEPDTWDWSEASDLVQLAGHTHGGQVRMFGRALRLPTLGRKYPLGHFDRPGNSHLIVSSGIGYSGPPVRINCPPEIRRLDLT